MDQLYAYSIAPVTKDLPVLITMCTPAERQLIFERVRNKIKDGKWQSAENVKSARGYISFVSQRVIEQTERGERRKQRDGKRGILILAYHAVLCMNGYYPTERKNVASHLCHNPRCVNIEHLEWSTAYDNRKREMCRRDKRCSCKLPKECIFGCV